ncbi:efflux RND transporter permease subunit [Rhizobium sp. TRM95111]|uniref:efflux RND transporter permease subunit n=1 Tax=Rhizobium alarense TaxID=2846851 RepID=UPI001F40B1C0|nr:efflux RND transporter permease subunit [Rhizobium alarense]MCF3638352.1 efflux RND transporter permease subunit [Rhizobium alarense]
MARYFITRPVFAWVIAIAIMVGGAMAITTLSVSQYPDIAPTTVRISATYKGATAQAIENSVTIPIEDAMTGLDDLTYMTSTSSTGSASVSLTFGDSIDADIAQVQVQNKLQLVESQLPDSVQQSGLTVTRSTSSILMVGTLVSTDGKRSSLELANILSGSIENQIQRLEGVGGINSFGSGYAMRIWLDPHKLSQYQLTASDVTSAVEAQNVQVSAGSIGGQPAVEGQQLNATVTAQSQLQTVTEFERIILKSARSGDIVRLSDVARVEIGQESYGGNARYNGMPAAGFGINLATGANAIDTAERVRTAMASIENTLPENVAVYYPYDTSPFVELSIEKVVHTLIEAIVLVFFVLLLFLQNLRATLIPTIAVPVVLLGTFGILALFGYSINTLTMFAMVLAIGLLVDDAIVVVENVERIMSEEGLSPLEATKKSMGEITGALIGIALVLTAVFIPMAFFGGSVGVIYRQFSVTIVSAMLLSVVVAIVLTPALCATILKSNHHKPKNRFFRWFDAVFGRATNGYVDGVRHLLGRATAVLAAFAAVGIAAGWLYTKLPSSFIPEEDQGVLMVMITLPEGAMTARTEAVVETVETHFLTEEKDAVESVFAALGFGFGSTGQNSAMAFVRLKDFSERTDARLQSSAIAGRAMAAFSKIRDAQVIALSPPSMPGLGNSSGFTMYLVDTGKNGVEALRESANRLAEQAEASGDISGFRGNSTNLQPQLKINIDQEKVGAFGLDLSAANGALSTIFAGTEVNDFILNSEIRPVIVQGDAEYRMQPDDIMRWYGRNEDGEMVPFSAIASTEWIEGLPTLARFNGMSAVELSGTPASGVSSGDAMDRMEQLTAELPGGYGSSWTGISYQERLSGSQAPLLYAVSMLVVFLCLAALYESWSVPVSVILAVPVGILGALVAAVIFSQSNDVYFKVGLLTTIGLAAKNAILIVEFAKDRHDAGANLFEATLEAARLRLRPIIMTSLAFILGVLPLAVATGAGSAAQNAIGIGVLGGMVSATILGIFFVPSFFAIVCSLTKRKMHGSKR